MATTVTVSRDVLTDVLGSAVAIGEDGIVNADLRVIGDFGADLITPTWDTVTGFTGRTEAAGLVEFASRAYDPTDRVWVQEDAFAGSVTRASSMNRYAYVEGSPVSHVDVLGAYRAAAAMAQQQLSAADFAAFKWWLALLSVIGVHNEQVMADQYSAARSMWSPTAVANFNNNAGSSIWDNGHQQRGNRGTQPTITGHRTQPTGDHSAYEAGASGLNNWLRAFGDAVIGTVDLTLAWNCWQYGSKTPANVMGCPTSVNSDGGFYFGRIGMNGNPDAEASYWIGSIVNPLLLVGGGSGGVASKLPTLTRLFRPTAAAPVASRTAVGFADDAVSSAYQGMRSGGGHAIRHLRDEGLVANSGSLSSQVAQFEAITAPILRTPSVTFDWRVGETLTRAFAGEVGGRQVVVFVAKEGPYRGSVLTAVVPDAAQMSMWGLP